MSHIATNFDPGQALPRSRCPHLGSVDDPATSTLYPSPIGYCYRVKPQEAIDLDHQAAYCLSAEYGNCPVLQQVKPTRLPKGVRRKGSYQYGEERDRGRVPILGTLLLFGLLVGAIFLFTRALALNTDEDEPVAAAIPTTSTATLTPSPSPTYTLRPSFTPRPTTTPTKTIPATFTVVPTAPPDPTRTPTPTPTPGDIIIIARTNTAGVNVRTGPHLSYPVVWVLDTIGSELTVTGQTEVGDWLQVCCQAGQGGWVARETVEVDGDLSNLPLIPLPKPRIMILPERVNIRSGPGVIYPVLAVADQGTEFEIVSNYQDGLWWELCCIGARKGWVIGESVAVYGDVSGIPASVTIPPTPTSTPEPIIPTATVSSNE